MYLRVDCFLREGLSFSLAGLDYLCRRVGQHGGAAIKQLAVVLRQSSRVHSGCHDVSASAILSKNIVHSFLNAGVRLMKLARCLRGKLAKHIPVPQSM